MHSNSVGEETKRIRQRDPLRQMNKLDRTTFSDGIPANTSKIHGEQAAE